MLGALSIALSTRESRMICMPEASSGDFKVTNFLSSLLRQNNGLRTKPFMFQYNALFCSSFRATKAGVFSSLLICCSIGTKEAQRYFAVLLNKGLCGYIFLGISRKSISRLLANLHSVADHPHSHYNHWGFYRGHVFSTKSCRAKVRLQSSWRNWRTGRRSIQ